MGGGAVHMGGGSAHMGGASAYMSGGAVHMGGGSMSSGRSSGFSSVQNHIGGAGGLSGQPSRISVARSVNSLPQHSSPSVTHGLPSNLGSGSTGRSNQVPASSRSTSGSPQVHSSQKPSFAQQNFPISSHPTKPGSGMTGATAMANHLGTRAGVGGSAAHQVNHSGTFHAGTNTNAGYAQHYHHSGYRGNSYFFGIGSPFGLYSNYGNGFGYPRYGYYGSPNYRYRPNYLYSSNFYSYYPSPLYSRAYALPLYNTTALAAIPTVAAIPAALSAPSVLDQPAVAPPVSGDEFAVMGESNFHDRKYEEAVVAWKHALVDDPSNGACVLLLAQALFQTGKFEEAAGATQQAAYMLPSESWSVVSGNYRELYSNIQDYTDKLRALEKARDEKPNEPAFHFLLGWHYGYLGYPKQAITELNKVIELAPNDEIAAKVRESMLAKLETPRDELRAPPPITFAPTKP